MAWIFRKWGVKKRIKCYNKYVEYFLEYLCLNALLGGQTKLDKALCKDRGIRRKISLMNARDTYAST